VSEGGGLMKRAGRIHPLERDYFLQFDKSLDAWPPRELEVLKTPAPSEETKPGIWMAEDWQHQMLDDQPGGYLWRKITRHPRESDPPQRRETTLREAMLRFPSAPLFGCQSKADFQVTLTSFNQHTLRLLKSMREGNKPIERLFLIFNGLNELDHFDFYYDLAALLIENGRETSSVACLIVPFPAHLTRYPLVGKYAEKPLQRFISDPSDLFRQYLRFMVETQWLISALVPFSHYPMTSGIGLLAAGRETNGSRCNPEILSGAIYEGWKTIFTFSERKESEISERDVLQSVAVLRKLIRWQPSTIRLVERAKSKRLDSLDPPQLHVIGYSLGGYLAQSVFFTWPFAIGSCTTLCSGGALNSLRPERIIHEEEWRAITHGLKYEIESGILEGRIRADDSSLRSICGIPVSYFISHFQTFTDIFLQDPYGTYRHRVSEFAHRLFFVVGGNDPIVPTRSVLDTSPPEGINMIEIANLSHFIRIEGGEWPDFWLPTIAGIISSLSDHSEKLLQNTTLKNLWTDDTSNSAVEDLLDLKVVRKHNEDTFQKRADAERLDPEPLNSEQTQAIIFDFMDLLEKPEKNGFLIVLRNQVPVTLMGPRVLHRRGTVPHYADDNIGRFWARLQEQRLRMREARDRVAIVVPGHLNHWFTQPLPTLSFKHLPVVQELPDQKSQQQAIWDDFLNDWETTGALYRFDPRPLDLSSEKFELEKMIRKKTFTPPDFWVLNCLPDTWISISGTAANTLADGPAERGRILEALDKRMQKIHGNDEGAEKDLEEWLNGQSLQILRISAAQSSPRFLGERIRDLGAATELLTHSVMAFARSQPCLAKGDFAKGWTWP
jgi:hypothetical protein